MFINFIGFVASKFLLFSTFYLSERQKGEGVKRERNAVEGRRHARPVGWPVPHCPQQPGSGTGILDSVCLTQDRQGPQDSSSTCCPWRGRSEENGARKRSWDLTRPWDTAGRHPEERLGHAGTPAPARSPRLPASPAPSVSSSWPPSWPELFVGEPGPSSRPPGPSLGPGLGASWSNVEGVRGWPLRTALCPEMGLQEEGHTTSALPPSH